MAISAEELIAAIKDLSASEQKRVANAFGTTTQVDITQQAAMTELQQQSLEIQQKALAAQQESARIFQDENTLIQARRESFENELRLKGLHGEELRRILEGEEAAIASVAERLGLEEGVLRKKQEQYKQDKISIEVQDKFGRQSKNHAKEIGDMLGINVKLQDTFLGKTMAIGQKLKGNSDFQAQFMRDIKETFSIQNLALSTLTKIGEVTMAFVKSADQARASLAAATGLGYEFNGVLIDVQRNANLFGVSMESAGKSVGSLITGTTDFVKLSGPQQRAIAETSAKLQRLNISTEESAKLFQNMTQALGMTAMSSNELTAQLAVMGNAIGISASQMTQDFNQSLSVLAVYGDQAPRVFTKLAAAAKEAGVEVSTLLALAGRFDTFQSAAESVAQLNAVLGTQLSTTEMLLATEEDRIEMLIESIQMGDQQFDQLDRFTQKAVAASVGITDMAEANKIFGMSMKEYKAHTAQMEKSANAQAKLDAAVTKAVPVFDKFKILVAELAIAVQPLLETFGTVADTLTQFAAENKMMTQIIVGFTAMGSAAIVLGTALAPLVMMFTTIGKMMTAAGGLAGLLGLAGAGVTGFLPVIAALAAVGAGVAAINAARPQSAGITSRAANISVGAGRAALTGRTAAATNNIDLRLDAVQVEIDGHQYNGQVKKIVNKEMAGSTFG